jgi:2-polyprenyl-3-methyl-5-hydroxy-6-metoxy-1,4-benzoquinol methylase
MDLKEEASFGGDPAAHWYYVSKYRALTAFAGTLAAERVLDVGAGSGVFSRMLLRDGAAESAVCVDPNYDEARLAERAPGLRFVRAAETGAASLILMIDVIEHVDDDAGLIRAYAKDAAKGARFLISVPAFQWLWSGHDEFLEHRRRYSIASLEQAVADAGLAPLKSRYFFGLLFPAVAAARIAGNLAAGRKAPQSAMRPAPALLSKALVAVHDLERALILPWNRIAGVSAFCLAEKR